MPGNVTASEISVNVRLRGGNPKIMHFNYSVKRSTRSSGMASAVLRAVRLLVPTNIHTNHSWLASRHSTVNLRYK